MEDSAIIVVIVVVVVAVRSDVVEAEDLAIECFIRVEFNNFTNFNSGISIIITIIIIGKQ